MGIALIQREKYFVNHKSPDNRHNKKGDCFHHDHAGIGIRVFKTDNKSQNNNTDNIVNDSRADDGSSHLALDFAQLLQGRHRNADAGCGHNRAHKNGFVEVLASPGRHSIKSHIQKRAGHQRDKHPEAGNQKCHRSCFKQFFQVRFKSHRKH